MLVPVKYLSTILEKKFKLIANEINTNKQHLFIDQKKKVNINHTWSNRRKLRLLE